MRAAAWLALAALPVASSAAPSPVPEPPLLAVALRETLDLWDVPLGLDPGTAVLNKLQLSATLRGDRFGLTGWSAHAQLFRFDGRSLSARVGDVQTADNLEAPPVTRLFEAWIARQWQDGDRAIGLRAGLIDLNSQFDSIDPASLFVNSSQGIAPDLSRSGRNGPSIYPVTAPAVTLTATPASDWTVRLGLFDGVPGNPDRPRAFAAQRFGRHDGLLGIVQADYRFRDGTTVEAGLWRYSAAIAGVGLGPAHDGGGYVSVAGPLPVSHVTGWVRAGLASPTAQTVRAYVGMGAVRTAPLAARSDDRLGLAIAHAIIGDPAVAATGVHHAETTVELSYQAKWSERIAVQPEVQFIHHPAGVAAAPDALAFGVRLVLSAGLPKAAPATDPTDPTVPPDAAPTTAPADAPKPPSGS